MANFDVFEAEKLNDHVHENAAAFKYTLEKLKDLPIVGDVRGEGFFYGIELVKDKDTKESFTEEESERILKDFVSAKMYEGGLYCRADDRGDPVIQLSPPLTVGQSEFDGMEQILRGVLTEAGAKRCPRPRATGGGRDAPPTWWGGASAASSRRPGRSSAPVRERLTAARTPPTCGVRAASRVCGPESPASPDRGLSGRGLSGRVRAAAPPDGSRAEHRPRRCPAPKRRPRRCPVPKRCPNRHRPRSVVAGAVRT